MPKLSAPTQMIFLISLALAILAVLGALVSIPFVSLYAFWIAIIGYIVLAAGCVMKGCLVFLFTSPCNRILMLPN